MNTLEKHNKEIEDELFGLLYDEYGDVGKNGNIKDFITSQNKSLLKKIAEGEIERFENIKSQIPKIIRQPFELAESVGQKMLLDKQLTHWQQVLQDLER